MKTTKRALTAAVLLSCACLMAPYYAHAEENVGEHITTNFGIKEINTPINISADEGVGILVSAPGNTLDIKSDVIASGANGIAIKIENTTPVESSNSNDSIPQNKIEVLNIDGALKGSKAAIYVFKEANVGRIYITKNASIDGNIMSNSAMPLDIKFGVQAKDGVVGELDPDSNLIYNANIQGENISMHIFGGSLEFNGTAEVQDIFIEGDSSLKTGGAILSGTGTYILTSQTSADGTVTRGTFNNMGTFDLGKGINKIYITGNYFQNGNAYLNVDFDTNGNSDKLVIKNGSATLNGYLTLTPQVDYYYNGQKITIDVVDAPSITNNIKNDSSLQKVIFNNISPVLNFSLNETETTDSLLKEGQYVINVERVEQGYQNVATDDISSGIGSAIDIDSQKKKDDEQYVLTIDKEKLLTSLDYPLTITNTDAERNKVVSNNLKKLNPNVVGSQAQAVIETHTTLNNLVSTVSSLNVGSMSMNTPVSRRIGGLGPTRVEPPKHNSWRNIVIPFSSYTDQHNGTNGYTNHNSGVIGAMERTFANGLTHGYHAALNHQSTEDSGSTIKGEGIYLGTHASYAPVEWNGWSVFGSARFGVEQMRSHRTVYIADSLKPYYGTADGDWTGYSGSFNIGAALTKEHGVVKSGPFAALDYSFAHRPSVHEDGSAVRTNLESATYDSLRTQLGYRLITNPKPLDSHDSTKWQAHASVAWNHELLNNNGRTSYELAEFPGTPIEDTIETYGRDSMSIAAGVIFKTPNSLDVGLTLGSDIYRKGGSSIYGKATFEWKF